MQSTTLRGYAHMHMHMQLSSLMFFRFFLWYTLCMYCEMIRACMQTASALHTYINMVYHSIQ